MAVYWYEYVKLEPGTENDYYAAIEHRLLPHLDQADDGPGACGVFKVDNNYSEWPTMVLLWRHPDWTAYAASRASVAGSNRPRLHLSAPFQWNFDGAKWRRSAFTRVLVPTGIAPETPVRPEVRSSGAVFFSQTVTVRHGQAAAFLDAVRTSVLPRAKDASLTLEGFWPPASRSSSSCSGPFPAGPATPRSRPPAT